LVYRSADRLKYSKGLGEGCYNQKRAKDTVDPSEIPVNVLAEAAADGVILIDEESRIYS
jgi:hypothetical protein